MPDASRIDLNALFSERLDGLMRHSGLTHREASVRINKRAGYQVVSPSNLSMMRRGQRNMPRSDKLVEIAKFFGVLPDYFIDPHPRKDGECERARAQVRARDVHLIVERLDGLPSWWVPVVCQLLDAARKASGLPPVCSDMIAIS